MKKLLLIPAFMTMFFAGSVAVPAAFAAQPAPPQESKMMLPPPKDGKRPPMPPRMRLPQLSNAEAAEKLQSAYGYRYSDMLRLLNIGYNYNDMNTACLYAYLSGEPVEKVLQLRQPATWGQGACAARADAEAVCRKIYGVSGKLSACRQPGRQRNGAEISATGLSAGRYSAGCQAGQGERQNFGTGIANAHCYL